MQGKMKSSHIEWIGNIPEEWGIAKGKAILTLLQRPVEPTDGIITCFRDGEVTLRTNRRTEGFTISLQEIGYQGIEEGDLVVHGMDGFAGAIGVSDSRGKGTPVLNVMDSSQNKRYLMYYLRTMATCGVFFSLSTGIRVRSCDTNWNKLKNIAYLLPPKETQNRIADFLDERCADIDALVKESKASIEAWKKMKCELITKAVTKGLVAVDHYKETGIPWIGEIPAEWECMPIKYLYDYSDGSAVRVGPFGSALSNTDIVDEGVWVYNQRAVVDDNFETNDTFVTEDKAKELEGFKVEPGDLLVTTRGTIGRIAIVPSDAMPGILHPCVIRFRIDEKKYSKELLKLIFNQTNVAQGQILNRSNSTTIEVLYSYSLKEIRLPVMPLEEQKKILDYSKVIVEQYDILIGMKEKYIKELEKYKKALIYECVTGKKEV